MKILFETYSGKKVTKNFKSLNETKAFVQRNKAFIKEAQIMEGPLGAKNSALLHPIKAIHNLKKGLGKEFSYRERYGQEDSFNHEIADYIVKILHSITQNEEGNSYSVGYDKYGFFIAGEDYTGWQNLRTMYDDGIERNIGMNNEKYGHKIYMPKLTKYIDTHKSLPSEKQLRNYLENLIDTRYKQNLEKQKKIKPESHMSRTDVEDF